MISVYVQGKKLNLYGDESIHITSKISDIEKLSNVFMDFSQSFTIPADSNNNDILKHYYDMTIDNGFGNMKRLDALLEIDTIPFRSGKIQIEGASKKNNRVENYKVTFFSDTIQLTELFGEDTLAQLDLSEYDMEWNIDSFEEAFSSPNFKDGDVYIPFMSVSDRVWQIGQESLGYTQSNILTEEFGIRQDEVRPALRMYRIIEAIEQKYNITFTRDFFDLPDFYELFLWLNEREQIQLAEFGIVNIGDFTGVGIDYDTALGGDFEYKDGFALYNRKLYNDSISFNNQWVYFLQYFYKVTPKAGFENVDYILRIVDIDGNNLRGPILKKGNSTLEKQWNSDASNISNPTLKRESASLIISPLSYFECDVELEIRYKRQSTTGSPSEQIFSNIVGTSNNNNLQQRIVVSENIPKMKVLDFIHGIMKMFKLVISPLSKNKFYIGNINDFYSNSESADITQYVDWDSVIISRPNLFNNIQFKYEQNDNIMNKEYRESSLLGYGDLEFNSEIETGKNLTVDVPFSNMLFERMSVLSGTSSGSVYPVVYGASSELDKKDNSIKPIKMKPTIFYKTTMWTSFVAPGGVVTNLPIWLRFFNGSRQINKLISSNTSNSYRLENVTNTLSFLATGDPVHSGIVHNTIYKNYWDKWINEIYDSKQRKLSVSGYLDLPTILNLKLSNRLIINDVRFKINDFKVNLMTKKVDFTLFKDIFSNEEVIKEDTHCTETSFSAMKKRFLIDIKVNPDEQWALSKSNIGYGTSWLHISKPTGTGKSKVWLEVSHNVSTTRFMELVITTDKGFNKTFQIQQFQI